MRRGARRAGLRLRRPGLGLVGLTRERLEREAKQNGRSLSQEAQVRLKESFDLPAQLQKQWGPPHIKALAQLISRVVRSVENGAGANPFATADSDLAWHRNAFTHTAVCAAISAILARHKPEGTVEIPEAVKKGTEWIVREAGEEQAERERTPEALGLSCARGVLDQLTYQQQPPPLNHQPNAHFAEGYYVFPDIHKILKGHKS